MKITYRKVLISPGKFKEILKNRLILTGSALLLSLNGISQIPAFPGAEGFGAVATGGRGGAVIEVTNLNDAGTGSLRAAIESSGARTVVFRVSGTIALQSRLSIKNDNITIAGQTAPGDGICLKNYTLTIDANNVIIRYIRSRMGDESLQEDDAMNGRNQSNIIIDHCTGSWSVDEDASFYDNENFTMQWCLFSESLYRSVHDKGTHGYGGIWGGKGATFHHNLLAHHTSRNPRFCGSRYSNQESLEKIDFRNNVVFNWGFNSGYGAEGGDYNLINNYYKPGPATGSGVRDRIFSPNADDGSNAQVAGIWGLFYVDGNYMHGSALVNNDNWKGIDPNPSTKSKDELKSVTEFDCAEVTTFSALIAYEQVLANAGCVIPNRDSIDQRIINEVITGIPTYGASYGAGKGIIDTQADVGGWTTLMSVTAPADTDHDGMPDEWEDANSLDKNNASDRNGDSDGDGYTNLEEYLNHLVDNFIYVLRPINFVVDTIADMEVTLSWEDISDNETGFIIERKEGNNWVELANVPANSTQYTDNNIPAWGDYTYRMKSIAGEVESYYTDSVQVKVVTTGILTRVNDRGVNLQVFPNPVTKLTRIAYTLAESSEVDLALMDLAGRKVFSLLQDRQPAGDYSYSIPDEPLGSGIFLVQLKTGNTLSIARVIITK
jgi:hypothetical protein